MPRKHPRSDAQVERLATQLRERWSAADGIMPWLRRRLPLLTRLHQEEGWSWADIGRALDAAGIRYESGRAWTGFLLARKVGQARAQARTRKAKRMDGGETPPLRRAAGTAPVPAGKFGTRGPARQHDGGGEPEPVFAPASLAPTEFVPSKPSHDGNTTSTTRTPPSPRKRVDADQVIRRLQGGSAGSDNEG